MNGFVITYLRQTQLHVAQTPRLRLGYEVAKLHQDLLSEYMPKVSAENFNYRTIPVILNLGNSAVPTSLAYAGYSHSPPYKPNKSDLKTPKQQCLRYYDVLIMR